MNYRSTSTLCRCFIRREIGSKIPYGTVTYGGSRYEYEYDRIKQLRVSISFSFQAYFTLSSVALGLWPSSRELPSTCRAKSKLG